MQRDENVISKTAGAGFGERFTADNKSQVFKARPKKGSVESCDV